MPTVRAIKGKKRTTYRVEAMVDGVRIASRTFQKKSEADLYAAQIEIHRYSAIGSNFKYLHSTTLSVLIDDYLASYNGKDCSLKQRLERWRVELGCVPLAHITKDKVRKVLKTLIDEGKSNATHNRYKSALSAAFSYANDEYDTDHNPCKKIKNKPEPQSFERWAAEDELRKLFEAAKSSNWPRMYLFILMAVHTGMRRGSLLSLRWNSIDFSKKVAYLPTSKNVKPIALPLNTEVMDELERYREVGNGFIFQHPQQPNKSFRNFDYHWKMVKKQAKIEEKLRVHDLRHTTGTWLAGASVPLTEIQQIMTHKSILTTQRYIHHDTASKAEKLRNVFGGLA